MSSISDNIEELREFVNYSSQAVTEFSEHSDLTAESAKELQRMLCELHNKMISSLTESITEYVNEFRPPRNIFYHPTPCEVAESCPHEPSAIG